MKILMYNATVVDDLGGPSIVSAFCDLTRSNMNEAVKFDLFIDYADDKTKEYLEDHEIGLFEYNTLFAKKNVYNIIKGIKRINKGKKNKRSEVDKMLERFSQYDCLVDMGGICFTDNIPQKNLLRTIYQKISWIVAKKLGLKVVLYTTSIGPINTFKTKYGSKYLLNCACDFVMLREQECESIYSSLKVNTPYIVCPDTAFCFKNERPKDEIWTEFNKKEKKVGVSLSFQLMKQTPHYFETMELVCQYLLDKGYNLVLIANECSGYEGSDDRFVVREMAKKVGEKKVMLADPVIMRGEHLKWIIASCDVVIASRYHTLMAALSSSVPSIALSWHFKYKEALKRVGLDNNVVENTSFSAKKIIELFEATENNHDKIVTKMQKNVYKIKEQVKKANKNFCTFILK